MTIEQPIFGMHVGTEADAKLTPIQESIDKTFPHPDYFSYLLVIKVESEVAEVMQGEDVTDIIKQIELEGKAIAVDLGSVESGVIPTFGSYNSIFILRIKGRLTPDLINLQNNTIQLPQDISIQEINPT